MNEDFAEVNKSLVVESGRVHVKQEPSTSAFIASPLPTSSTGVRTDSACSTSQYVDLEPFYRAMEEVAFEQFEDVEEFEMMEECGEFEDQALNGHQQEEEPMEEAPGSARLPESRLKDFGSDAERAFTKEELPEGQPKYSCLVADCDYSYVPTTKMPKAVVKNLRLHVKRHMYESPPRIHRLYIFTFRIAYENRKRQATSNSAQQMPNTCRVKDEASAGAAEVTRPSVRTSDKTRSKRPEPSSRSLSSSSLDEGRRDGTGRRTDMDKICEKSPIFRRVNSVAVTAGSKYHERKKGTHRFIQAYMSWHALDLRKNPKTAQNPDADPELQTLHAAYALANRRRARFRQLMRQKPANLTKLLKAGMSLNQIFRKLPRTGSTMSEQEEAELIDPEEEVREANYRKRKYRDPLPSGMPVVKRAKKSRPDDVDEAPKPKKRRQKGPRSETVFMRTWPTYARLTGIYRRHRYRFNRFMSGEYPDETGEELRRCTAEMDLAKRRRAHFRALAWKDPKKLAECVRDGLNVNEIFKRLPLKGKPVAADLFDPLEASYSAANGRRNGQGSGSSTPLNRVKSETPDADVIDLSSDEDEREEDDDDGDSSDNGCDSDEESPTPRSVPANGPRPQDKQTIKKLTEEREKLLEDLLKQGLGANEIFRHFLDAGDAVVTAKYEDLEDRQEAVDHQRLIKQAQSKKKGDPRVRVYDVLRKQYPVYGRLESVCVVQAKRYERLKSNFESKSNLTAQEKDALDHMAASNALAKRRRTHFRRVLAEHRAKVDELLDQKGVSLNEIFKQLTVEGSFTFDEVYDPEEEAREEDYRRKSHHYDSRRGPRDKMHKKVKSEVVNCRWTEFRQLKMAARRRTKLYTEFKKKLEEGDCPDDEALQTELESLQSKMALAVRRRDRFDALYLDKADELRCMLDAGKSFNEIFEELALPSDAGPTAASDFFDPEEHLRVSKEKESRECLDRFTKEEKQDGTVLYKCSFDGCPYAFEATGVKELLDIRRSLVGHYRGKHL
ncbi:hypothetical protein AAVH_23793 [Aphelenchoides avenae]|nr:hypothetical protein AAVH_23793 [Aphelenchus avenae]